MLAFTDMYDITDSVIYATNLQTKPSKMKMWFGTKIEQNSYSRPRVGVKRDEQLSIDSVSSRQGYNCQWQDSQ